MRRFCWWRRRLFALNRVDDDDNGCGIRGVASPLPPPSSSSLPLTILSLPIKSQATPSPTPYRATVSARYDGATNEGTLSAATAAAWKWRRRAVGLAALAIFELLLLLFLLAILLVYRRRSLSEGLDDPAPWHFDASVNASTAAAAAAAAANERMFAERETLAIPCVDDPRLNALIGASLLAKLPRPRFEYCSMRGDEAQNGRGRVVLIVGNSFAKFQAPAIVGALAGRFARLHLFVRPHCAYADRINAESVALHQVNCSESAGLVDTLVERLRPDWLFLAQRTDQISLCARNAQLVEHLDADRCLRYMETAVRGFQRYVRHVFLLEANAIAADDVPLTLARRLKEAPRHNGNGLGTLALGYQEVLHTKLEERIRTSAIRCGAPANCTVIPVQDALCSAGRDADDANRCELYDPHTQLAYYADATHLSLQGNKRIQPLIRSAIDRVLVL